MCILDPPTFWNNSALLHTHDPTETTRQLYTRAIEVEHSS